MNTNEYEYRIASERKANVLAIYYYTILFVGTAVHTIHCGTYPHRPATAVTIDQLVKGG